MGCTVKGIGFRVIKISGRKMSTPGAETACVSKVDLTRAGCWDRCRANMAHTRQSRPDPVPGLLVQISKFVKLCLLRFPEPGALVDA